MLEQEPSARVDGCCLEFRRKPSIEKLLPVTENHGRILQTLASPPQMENTPSQAERVAPRVRVLVRMRLLCSVVRSFCALSRLAFFRVQAVWDLRGVGGRDMSTWRAIKILHHVYCKFCSARSRLLQPF